MRKKIKIKFLKKFKKTLDENGKIGYNITCRWEKTTKTEDGELAEWSKAHDWKSCVRDERTQGSNPCLTANKQKRSLWGVFCLYER